MIRILNSASVKLFLFIFAGACYTYRLCSQTNSLGQQPTLEIITTDKISGTKHYQVYSNGVLHFLYGTNKVFTLIPETNVAKALLDLENLNFYSLNQEMIYQRLAKLAATKYQKGQDNSIYPLRNQIVIDGSTTTLRVASGKGTNQVTIFAADVYAAEYPEISELYKIQQSIQCAIICIRPGRQKVFEQLKEVPR